MNHLKKIVSLRSMVMKGIFDHQWLPFNDILNDTNEEIIAYVLPKTGKKALLNVAIKAVCNEHDNNIHGNKIHLFRLPQHVEVSLASLKFENSQEDYIDALEKLAVGVAVDTKTGPVNIGNTSEIDEEILIHVFAKHYLDAFQNNYKTYPYLN
jgi:hypothetical protein